MKTHERAPCPDCGTVAAVTKGGGRWAHSTPQGRGCNAWLERAIANGRRDRVMCERFLAGESPTALACDYGCTWDEVLDIIRRECVIWSSSRKAKP